MEKVLHFQNAVKKLNDAKITCQNNPQNTIMRYGMIHRFELAFDLSWKASKEYLVEEGFLDVMHSPKQILRTAYECRMIDDEAVWLDMLDARSRTSHIYDDHLASVIAKNITDSYLPVLKKLSDYFKENQLLR